MDSDRQGRGSKPNPNPNPNRPSRSGVDPRDTYSSYATRGPPSPTPSDKWHYGMPDDPAIQGKINELHK